MNFINNWQRDIALAAGALSCPLDIPDGTYRLTLSDSLSSATRWELVTATVTAGEAALVRGVEGSADQEWPSGSVIYCAITAAVLTDAFQRISALEAEAIATSDQIADLTQRVEALEPAPAFLYLEVDLDETEWDFGGGPLITSIQTVSGGVVAESLDLSICTQADDSIGATVYYNSGTESLEISYNEHLTLINTGVELNSLGSFELLRVGILPGFGNFGWLAMMDAYDPRSELGFAQVLASDEVVYVDIAFS